MATAALWAGRKTEGPPGSGHAAIRERGDRIRLVAVPLPDSDQARQADIALKLDAPLTGKVEIETEFQWEGVPSAFTPSLFLLTMDTERAKLEGLKITPCSASAKKR